MDLGVLPGLAWLLGVPHSLYFKNVLNSSFGNSCFVTCSSPLYTIVFCFWVSDQTDGQAKVILGGDKSKESSNYIRIDLLSHLVVEDLM